MELACIIISAFAALFSAITAFISYHNGKLTSQGNLELQIRALIMQAKVNVLDHKDTGKESITAYDEDLFNAYDEACAKYIDKKVDRERFKKMYMHEIRQLVEEAPYKSFFNQKSCRFDAILKVYDEWNHSDR